MKTTSPSSTAATITGYAFPTYPARPVNGGPPRVARPKVGLWITQPKFNGWRSLVHLAPDGTTPVWNRHGERLTIASDFSDALAAAAAAFPKGTWLDCEALQRRGSIRNTLVILDIILPDLPWTSRKALLNASGVPVLPWNFMPAKDYGFSHGRLVITDEIPADFSLHAACEHFALVNTDMAETVFEGVVMKKADSTYPFQTRSPGTRCPYWVKHRFVG